MEGLALCDSKHFKQNIQKNKYDRVRLNKMSPHIQNYEYFT